MKTFDTLILEKNKYNEQFVCQLKGDQYYFFMSGVELDLTRKERSCRASKTINKKINKNRREANFCSLQKRKKKKKKITLSSTRKSLSWLLSLLSEICQDTEGVGGCGYMQLTPDSSNLQGKLKN